MAVTGTTQKPNTIPTAPPAAAASGAKPAASVAPATAAAPTAPAEMEIPDTKLTTTVGAPAKGMKPNQNPTDVKKVQNALKFLGADVEVTGHMDDKTIAAIKIVQQAGIDQFKKDPKTGINPALFAGGKPDGIIQPGKASNKFLTAAVMDEAQAEQEAAQAAPPPATSTTPTTPTSATTAKPAAAPAQADYIHGVGHSLENERSGEAMYQGLGIGNRDDGSKNLGIVSGAEQMFAGKTEQHGAVANAVIGTGAVLSGAIRTVASAPYVALDNLDQAMDRVSNSDSGFVSFLAKAVQWLFIKPFKLVAAIFNFLGGMVSSLFLWDNGGKDLTNRVSDTARDAFEGDVSREHRLEREQISRDVDESNRSDAKLSAAELKKIQDDKATHDATVKSLTTSIATLSAQVNAEKDPATKKALQGALDSLKKDLSDESNASKADQAKIDAASKATTDNRYAKVANTIEEINGLMKEDEKSVASEKPTNLDARTKIQSEIGELKVILASQSKVLAGLTPPKGTSPTAPASGTATTTASGATGSTSSTGAVPPPAVADVAKPKSVVTDSAEEIQIN